jgi:hypothetical protein
VAESPSRTPRHSTYIGPAPTPTPVLDLPPVEHPAWAGLVTGSLRHDFSYAAAGMLVFNLNLQWRRDPSKLGTLIRQARAFFQKYRSLLSHDVQRLFN